MAGILDLINSDVLLGATATISTTSTFDNSKMIVADGGGLVRKAFSGINNFTYRIGSEDFGIYTYSPLNLDVTALTGTGTIDANVTDVAHTFPTPPTDFIERYWTVNKQASITTIDYNLTATYDQSDVVGTESNLLNIKFSGATGEINGPTNILDNTINFTAQNSFSDFTAANSAALPIELADLKAKNQNGNVSLDWVTNCEKGSDRFDVERSANGKDWAKLGDVKAKGYCSVASYYNFMDNNAANGVNYYRLKMLDADGKFSFSNVVNATIQNAKGNLSLSPNPAFDRVNLNISQNGKYNIFDATGKNIESGTLQGTQLNVNHLQSGIYFLKVNNETLRFVKQ